MTRRNGLYKFILLFAVLLSAVIGFFLLRHQEADIPSRLPSDKEEIMVEIYGQWRESQTVSGGKTMQAVWDKLGTPDATRPHPEKPELEIATYFAGRTRFLSIHYNKKDLAIVDLQLGHTAGPAPARKP